jgi:hypothetical protein
MDLDRLRFSPWLPFSPWILVISDQFSLLGVHRDDRLPLFLKGTHLFGDISELGVPIWMTFPFLGLAIGL